MLTGATRPSRNVRRWAGVIALALALAGLACGDEPRKLGRAGLDRLELVSDQLANMQPHAIRENLLSMLASTRGLFGRTCAEGLRDYPYVARNEAAVAARRLAERCGVTQAAADSIFSVDQRQHMSAPDHLVTGLALARTRTALETEGSARAKQIWNRFQSHLPAIATALARDRAVVTARAALQSSPIGLEVVSLDGTPVDPALPTRLRELYLGDLMDCRRSVGDDDLARLTGRAHLTLTVMPLGLVAPRSITSKGSGLGVLDDCLASAASRWTFARPIDAESHQVIVNITFATP